MTAALLRASAPARTRTAPGGREKNLASLPRSGRTRTDSRLVHRPTASGTEQSPPEPAAPSASPAVRYGLPLDAFRHAWRVEDIQGYAGIGRTQAYALVKDPSFPPRLRTGRSHRWNGLQVLAWLHRDDWRLVDAADPEQTPTSAPEPMAPAPRERGNIQTASRPGNVGDPDDRSAVESSARSRRTPRSVSALDRTDGPDTPTVIRRVIDPAEVHRARRSLRLQELSRPADMPPATAPATAPTSTPDRKVR